jgi:hypothetical protein
MKQPNIKIECNGKNWGIKKVLSINWNHYGFIESIFVQFENNIPIPSVLDFQLYFTMRIKT